MSSYNSAISGDLQDNTKRWDKSILYSRVAIIILAYCTLLCWVSIYIDALDRGIAVYGGLFHLTSTSQIFQIFILLLSAAILQLTAFYPRKVWAQEH
jgi:NADH-ubiquinone oxidoreductase chain 2